MTKHEFHTECVSVQHANFKLGYYIDLSVNLAIQAATVFVQDEHEIPVAGSARMDLVCEQLINQELN